MNCNKVIKKYKKLDYILNTHHHADHVDGNIQLKKKYNSKIIGFYDDKNRIPVRIKADILVGSIKADLENFKNLKHPLKIIVK